MGLELTVAARQRLEAELTSKYAELRAAQDAVVASRDAGDIAENNDFHVAREEEGRIRARMSQITEALKAPDAEPPSGEVVALGVLATIDFGDNDCETYLFSTCDDTADDGTEVLTSDSPIGSAVSGLAVGESAVAETPAGPMEVRVVSISL